MHDFAQVFLSRVCIGANAERGRGVQLAFAVRLGLVAACALGLPGCSTIGLCARGLS
jgi:hypothetical protein